MLHLVHAKAQYKRETYRALHRVDHDDCAEHKIKNLRFRSMSMRGTRETQVFYYIGNIA